jgi:hypothetical protein
VTLSGAAQFLSEGWFVAARSLVVDVAPEQPRSGVDCRVQYEVGGSRPTSRFFQVVEDGVLRRWEAGDISDPDVEIRWDRQHARRVFGREVDGTDALAATVITAPDGYVGPAPPMDLGERPELQQLPVIPDATITVQYEFPRGPFGHVSHVISFVDGQVRGMDYGRAPERDVMARVSYLAMAKVRTGEFSIYQALEDGGKVDGKLGPLALLAGICESPEFHRAELACSPVALALGRLGEAFADPVYQTALDELARRTCDD